MNIAAGKISTAAREAIEARDSRIDPTGNPQVSLVVMPGAEIIATQEPEVRIALDEESSLIFTRAWHTEECSLSLLGE